MKKYIAVVALTSLLFISVASTPSYARSGPKYCSTTKTFRVTCPKPAVKKVVSAIVPSLDNLNSWNVRGTAYSNIMAAIKLSSENKHPEIVISASSSVDPTYVSLYRDTVTRMAKLVNNYWSPANVNIIMNSGLDNGQGTACNNGSFQIPVTTIQCVTPGAEGIQNHGGLPAHEYLHLLQAANNSLGIIWFAEGSATYLGESVGHPSSSGIDSYFLEALARSKRDASQDIFAGGYLKDNSSVVSLFKYLETSSFDDPIESMKKARISYWAGSVATEVLIALYGVPKFMDFNIAIGKNGFAMAFQNTYGFSIDTFYEKLAPYFLSGTP